MKKQYIWEYFLDRAEEDIHFEQAEKWNPYSEIVMLKDKTCIFNTMFRYEKIFLPYLEKYGIPSTQREKILFDICAHFLALVDVQKGCTYRELQRRKYEENIEEGLYGNSISQIYRDLPIKKKHIIMHYLELQHRIANDGNCDSVNIFIFQNVVLHLLESGVFYKDRCHKDNYILYVGLAKDENREKLIVMTKELFLPLSCRVEVLWDKHFGILGEQQTLCLGNVRLM